MGSKLTSTGVTFGSNTTEQTKPVKIINSQSADDLGKITFDVGCTSSEYSSLTSRTSTLETPYQWSLYQTYNNYDFLYSLENSRRLVYFKDKFYIFTPMRGFNSSSPSNLPIYASSSDLNLWNHYSQVLDSNSQPITTWYGSSGTTTPSTGQLQTTVYVFKDKMYRINIYGRIFSTSDGVAWTDHGINSTILQGQNYLRGRVSCIHDGKVWLSGGIALSSSNSSLGIYYSTDGTTFTQDIADYGGGPRCHAHMISLGQSLYIVGGNKDASNTNKILAGNILTDVWQKTLNSNTWNQISTYIVDSNEKYYHYQGQVIGNRFYIFSMYKDENSPSPLPDVYSTGNSPSAPFVIWRKEVDPAWSLSGNFPGIHMSSAVKNQKVYSMGGDIKSSSNSDTRFHGGRSWSTNFGNLTWGDTQEITCTSGSYVNNIFAVNEVPANCVMVGMVIRNHYDNNTASEKSMAGIILRIRYKNLTIS